MSLLSSFLPAALLTAPAGRGHRVGGVPRAAGLTLLALASGCAHLPGAGRSADPAAQLQARRDPQYRQALVRQVQARIAKVDPNLHVGISVLAGDDGSELFAYNAGERFVPASTVKLLTAATALDVLGPAYRFTTELWADGYDRDSKSVRNLYLRGSGDPSLQLGDLAELVATLRQAGVARIVGEVVLDDGAFDRVPWGRGWMWDDLGDGFSAPISALSIAGNALSLWVVPGSRVAAPVRAFLQPATRYVSYSSTASTTAAGTGGAIRLFLDGNDGALEGPPLTPDPAAASFAAPQASAFSATDLALLAGHHVNVSGSMAVDAAPRLRRFAVRDASQWVATLLREQLLAQRVDVPANWRRGSVPPAAQLLASHTSESLGTLLPGYVKVSDNHALECVLKRVGAQASGQPGSFANGVAAVRRYLDAAIGPEAASALLFDGSGASRYNLLTPAQLGRIVWTASRRFDNGVEFVASLPIGGTDGTLSHRMRTPTLRDQVRAKTGTMTGVSALAGLLSAAGGTPLVFAIMVDHATCSAEALRNLQDDVLRLLQRPPDAAR